MQISIHVPDTLPLPHLEQRIREFEASLQAEAAHLNQNKNLKALLMAMPNVGEDADFQRTQDFDRATDELFPRSQVVLGNAVLTALRSVQTCINLFETDEL